jgi:6-phospho-3-hexuloisomerase
MNYGGLVKQVLDQNRQVLEAVNPDDVERLVQEILRAKTIHLYAMGRMQLSVRAFAMRLKHMGIETYVVYDTTSPRIGPGDLLIDHCAVTNVVWPKMRVLELHY